VYTLINLVTGQRMPLLAAPNARSLGYFDEAEKAVWFRNSRRVLITNTFLPIDPGSKASSDDVLPCGVASVDLPSLKARCLYFENGAVAADALHLQDASFGGSMNEVTVLLRNHLQDQEVRNYVFRENQWSLMVTRSPKANPDGPSALADIRKNDRHPLRVFVRQSLNDPPVLSVRASNGTVRELWNPNPQFLRMQFGQASLYQWRDETGREWSGVLVKPVGYTAGERYPLVLQMYDYVDHQFITDGLDPTAFAARELASAGFVVLQIRKQRDTMSEDDPAIALDGYRSAIAHLAATGMIDQKRVGVVGFSLTCWYAIYALVRDPALFAAATIADGLDNSYMQFELFAPGNYLLEKQMIHVRGVAPFGAGLAHWVEAASAFHLDRVEAPVRIEAIGPSSVIQEWDLYSSLELLHKPVDLIYFPNGTHIHKRPLARLESQQGNVDWMCFWLKDEELPDQSKIAPYAEWEAMRRERAVARSSAAQRPPD
jgi:hypothetical protein